MDRFAYIAWFLRDLNLCEFGNGLLLAAAPLLWLRRRNLWLIRIPILLACYLAATALLCPFKGAVFSEVRYLCPTIPLWIALGVVVILELTRGTKTLILPAGILLFWTNLLSANWLIPFPYPAAGWLTPYPYAITSPRSTSYLYGRELWMPPADPYRLAANWIGANMSPGQTIWVAPGYAVYPLMFDAPQVVYGWQLSFPPKEPYRNLPEIYFLGRQAPDVMIGFAGWVENVRNLRKQMEAAGIHYRELPALDCFGRDAFRPELFRRTFRSISGFNPETEGVHIFQRSEIDNAGQGLPAR
jgi:hypothetical protein